MPSLAWGRLRRFREIGWGRIIAVVILVGAIQKIREGRCNPPRRGIYLRLCSRENGWYHGLRRLLPTQDSDSVETKVHWERFLGSGKPAEIRVSDSRITSFAPLHPCAIPLGLPVSQRSTFCVLLVSTTPITIKMHWNNRQRTKRILLIRTTLLLVVLLQLCAQRASAATLPDGMAIRSVFNGGRETLTKFCSDSESELIQKTIGKALFSLKRRNVRRLCSGYGDCEDHCIGMDRFTCYWYTESCCGSFRRGLSAEDDEGVRERLLLAGQDDLIHQCNQVKSTVLTTLIQDLESLSESCESLVLSTLELKCYFKND